MLLSVSAGCSDRHEFPPLPNPNDATALSGGWRGQQSSLNLIYAVDLVGDQSGGITGSGSNGASFVIAGRFTAPEGVRLDFAFDNSNLVVEYVATLSSAAPLGVSLRGEITRATCGGSPCPNPFAGLLVMIKDATR